MARPLATVLGLLAVFGPISMDLYLPVLPALAQELQASPSAAQLTVTACLLGLAGGQIVAGPLSDRFGHRPPLLVGVTAYVIASVLCAVSPSIEVLVAVRFVQGLAGSVGIVIAQAAGRDLYSGGKLVRYYGRLAVLGGLAAIVGPLIGGQLARVTDWRGVFLFLAVVGALILVAVHAVFRETLSAADRSTGGLTHLIRNFGRLMADRTFVAAVFVIGFANAALFAYLSGATFVLQGIYGLSPQQYSFAFGLNSLSFIVFGYTAGRLSERRPPIQVLGIGLALSLLGASALLTTAILHLSLAVLVTSLVIMVGGVAASTPPVTAIALAGHARLAGTASSLLGLVRYGSGGLAAPLVGLGGAGTAVPLGVVATTALLAAGVVHLAIQRPVS